MEHHQENAQIARDILAGKQGAKMDAVLLNAGAAIYIASDNLTMQEAVDKARELIMSGKAAKQLELLMKKQTNYAITHHRGELGNIQ